MPNHCTRRPLLAFPLLVSLLVVEPLAAQVPVPVPGGNAQLGQLARNTVPSVAYYNAIERLYRGDYRDAERTLRREARSSIKIGVTTRWIDAIAYHAMLGEVYYQQGRLDQALVEFDKACLMYLQYPNWMIRVDFKRGPTADTNRLRQVLPWGKSTRQFTLGRFQNQELIAIGDPNQNAQNAQQGGVLTAPQYWQLDVIEIVRATTLAIRRRNELLGPLAKHDAISNELVTVLSRGGNTTPNHWSKAWTDLELGVAQAGVGQVAQAEKSLARAQRVAGQFDSPLTGVALLELGRLKLEAGDLAAAASLFAEASYSAFYYEDLNVIDEAFRLGTITHLASGPKEVNAALEPAAAWASRERYNHLFARISLALTEELLHFKNTKGAQSALVAGRARLKDAARGLLGNRSLYFEGRLQLLQGRDNATATLSRAVQQEIGMSAHNLQLLLANQRYDRQQLRARTAVEVYQSLLGDPASADWVLRPFETLTRLQTPHEQAFNLWLDAVLARKDMASALEVSDLAKRNRYHRSLAWGGRLAALRDALESPKHLLGQQARNQRNELLLRFPKYEKAMQAGRTLEADLSKQWQPGIDDRQERDLVKLWREWDKTLEVRESMISQMGVERVAADMQFPPILPTTALQKQLQPGQAIVVFHESPAYTIGFLLTATDSTSWQCAPSKQLDGLLSKFLRDLGNYDANHEMTIADLQSTNWQDSGNALFQALFEGSSLNPAALEELIVVPDGVTWYVPFAALPVSKDDEVSPLISTARVRIAPTVGLAVGSSEPWRRVQRTAIVGEEIVPGDSEAEKVEALSKLRDAVENPIAIPDPAPVPTPIIGAEVETLVVLDEIEIDLSEPLDWAPLPLNRIGKKDSLSDWLKLPQTGPQRIVLPACRTLAERGGRTSKRKAAKTSPGSELFLASCGLLSTGAQTVLISSWRVGGDTTMELTREFLQELPYTDAPAAWQRSVQLAMELPLTAERQSRVKTTKKDQDTELTAKHPFFWAGFLLVDTGATIEKDAEPAAPAPPVARAQPAAKD